jgi:hypothetical protein
MYIEITKDSEVNLMGMDLSEAKHLASMIRSACLMERRAFNKVLGQLEKEAGV